MINRKYYIILKHAKGVSSDIIEGEITLEQAVVQFLNMYFPGAQALFPAQEESNFQGRHTNYRYTVVTTASKYKLVVIHQEDEKTVLKSIEERLTDIERRLTQMEGQRHPALVTKAHSLSEAEKCATCGVIWGDNPEATCPYESCPKK